MFTHVCIYVNAIYSHVTLYIYIYMYQCVFVFSIYFFEQKIFLRESLTYLYL